VFWETANRREFAADEQRSAYRRMYFDYYWEQAPELFLLALGPTSEPAEPPQVLGYVCGVADTRRHGELYELAPHIRLFDDLYERYPAHLHINLTAASRGRGLGSELISALEDRLTGRVALAEVTDRGGSEPSQRAASPAAIPAPGLHLVTAAGARNTRFYRKNGFVDEYPRRLGAAAESAGAGPVLLFMGKRLGSTV
jgi:GNAT superfamily N-acetyltransferase